MKVKLKGIIRAILFLGLGIFLVSYALKGLGPEERTQMKTAFAEAEYTWLFVSILFGIFSHWIRALRWNLLIDPLREGKTNAGNTMGAVMVGYLANLAIPRLGEVTRCGVLNKYEKVPFTTLLGTVITERIVDMLLVVLIMILNVLIEYKEMYRFFSNKIMIPMQEKLGKTDPMLPIGMVVLGVILFIFIRIRRKKKSAEQAKPEGKVAAFMKGMGEGLKSIRKLEKPGLFYIYSILIWLGYFISTWICFFSFESTSGLSLGAGLSVLTFGSFAMIAVQGGIGAYPLMVMLILQEYDVEKVSGLAYGWIVWSGQFVLILAGGFFSLLFLPVYESRRNKFKMGSR